MKRKRGQEQMALPTFDYSYDISDRLTSMSDSDSLATDFQFVYDDRGQLQLERQLNGFVGTSVVFDRDYL